jgi:hypothetical protein
MSEYNEMAATREKRAELVKQAATILERMGTLTNTHPKGSGWNLLFKKTANPNEVVSSREYISYEYARMEQEKLIRRLNPVWTAVVRDRRARKG